MTVIDVEVDTGEVKALPVSPTSADVTLLSGQCRLVGWSLRDTTTPAPSEFEGSVVSPGAGVIIVSLVNMRAGTYDVSWTVALQGAAGAGDANNFELWVGGTAIESSVNPGAAGSYPQVSARVTVPAGAAIHVNSSAAGTVGVTYLAQAEAVPTLVGATTVEIQDGGNVMAEVSLAPGEAKTSVLSDHGILCQNQIRLHMVSGSVTGAVYAKFGGGEYPP